MADDELHEQRMVKIELLLMQLQHDVDQLSKALIEQQAEIESVRRAVDRLAVAAEEGVEEPRSPEEERPPHY